LTNQQEAAVSKRVFRQEDICQCGRSLRKACKRNRGYVYFQFPHGKATKAGQSYKLRPSSGLLSAVSCTRGSDDRDAYRLRRFQKDGARRGEGLMLFSLLSSGHWAMPENRHGSLGASLRDSGRRAGLWVPAAGCQLQMWGKGKNSARLALSGLQPSESGERDVSEDVSHSAKPSYFSGRGQIAGRYATAACSCSQRVRARRWLICETRVLMGTPRTRKAAEKPLVLYIKQAEPSGPHGIGSDSRWARTGRICCLHPGRPCSASSGTDMHNLLPSRRSGCSTRIPGPLSGPVCGVSIGRYSALGRCVCSRTSAQLAFGCLKMYHG